MCFIKKIYQIKIYKVERNHEYHDKINEHLSEV